MRHSLLIQSLFLKPFVSYLLNIDLFRGLRELLRSDYILIESLAVMLSTGITGGAYKLDPDPLMPYPYLLAWCWSGILTVFFDGFTIDASRYTIHTLRWFRHIFAFATHRLSLDSYRVRLLVVLPFNPALAYWLLPIKLGVMLSLLHLEGRAYRTAVHLQM